MFGNSHGWLIGDDIRLANSFVLSADWPSDLAAEHADRHKMLIHPRVCQQHYTGCDRVEHKFLPGGCDNQAGAAIQRGSQNMKGGDVEFVFPQDSEAIAKDEVQKVLLMTEDRRRAWENAWEQQRNKLEQNLQVSQFYFDLRAVSTSGHLCATNCGI